MLALVVAVAIINIGLGIAVTRWSFIMKRQREIELVWRGEKYAQALDCYSRQQGALPTDLEQLVEARCIRRLYDDPASDSGEWQVLRVADLVDEEGAPATAAPSAVDSELAGDTMSGSGQGLRARIESRFESLQRRSSGELFPDRGSLRDRVAADRPRDEGVGGDGPEEAEASEQMDGIVGVVSTSDEESIRPRSGGSRYSDWRFMAGGSQAGTPPLPGLSTQPEEAQPEGGQGEADSATGSTGRTGLRERVQRTSGDP